MPAILFLILQFSFSKKLLPHLNFVTNIRKTSPMNYVFLHQTNLSDFFQWLPAKCAD